LSTWQISAYQCPTSHHGSSEAFTVLEMFQDDALYKLTNFLTYHRYVAGSLQYATVCNIVNLPMLADYCM